MIVRFFWVLSMFKNPKLQRVGRHARFLSLKFINVVTKHQKGPVVVTFV
jgi:hypothetical protein